MSKNHNARLSKGEKQLRAVVAGTLMAGLISGGIAQLGGRSQNDSARRAAAVATAKNSQGSTPLEGDVFDPERLVHNLPKSVGILKGKVTLYPGVNLHTYPSLDLESQNPSASSYNETSNSPISKEIHIKDPWVIETIGAQDEDVVWGGFQDSDGKYQYFYASGVGGNPTTGLEVVNGLVQQQNSESSKQLISFRADNGDTDISPLTQPGMTGNDVTATLSAGNHYMIGQERVAYQIAK